LAEDLYELPQAEISQGDILEILPNSHLVPPLTALFPRSEGIMACEPDTHPEFNNKRQPVVASCRRAKAMLLTYDCEISKPEIKNWIVSPVVPLSEIPGHSHGHIKKNRVFHLLYLPEYRDILEDSVLVLNHVTTLSREFVSTAHRIMSLSDTGRRALYVQHLRWLSRCQLNELRCPNCTALFNAADAMTVRPID
jgi:hypothetical protein